MARDSRTIKGGTPSSRSSSATSKNSASRPDSSAKRDSDTVPSRPQSSLQRMRPPSSRLPIRNTPARQPSARMKRTSISTVSFYDRAKIILSKPIEERTPEQLNLLEGWFRKRSKLFVGLKHEVLQDVVKHCEVQSVPKDYVIIQQAYVGTSFFIILRGKVSIMVKDELEEDDDDVTSVPEVNERHSSAGLRRELSENRIEEDRSKFGHFTGHLNEGQTFGELALVNNNCTRTATVISDEPTDLIVISRELYNRSLAKIVSEEYEERLTFVNSNVYFRDWANKWKRQLALSLVTQHLSYEEVLCKQGENADHLYFVTGGELKLVADPALHKQQFSEFISKSTGILQEDSPHTFPQGLVNYLSPKSRQVDRLKSATYDVTENTVPLTNQKGGNTFEGHLILSPSAERKRTAKERAQLRKYNICFLGTGQLVGDVEVLTGLTRYHASAICTKANTTVFRIHHVQFNRIIKKKNPDTLTAITKQLGLQMPRRLRSELVHRNVPLLKYIIIKLDDLNGTVTMPRKPRDDLELPRMDTPSPGHHDSTSLPSRLHRAKSGVSSRSYPQSSRSFPLTGNMFSLHESVPCAAQLNLATVPSMSHYLNQQFQHIIGTEKPDGGGGGRGEGTQEDALPTAVSTGEGGVYNLAKHQRTAAPKSELTKLPARSGIFFKLMQVTQRNVDKEDLAIGEEEFHYLCQLRRRIARQLNEFYPFASLESFLQLDEDQRPKRERRSQRQSAKSAPQNRKKLSKSLPNIKGSIGGKAVRKDKNGSQESIDDQVLFRTRGGPNRTRVAFSMPSD